MLSRTKQVSVEDFEELKTKYSELHHFVYSVLTGRIFKIQKKLGLNTESEPYESDVTIGNNKEKADPAVAKEMVSSGGKKRKSKKVRKSRTKKFPYKRR